MVPTQVSVTSSSVGLGKTGNFSATNKSNSMQRLNAYAKAAWAGWPYTVEKMVTVPIGSTRSFIDTQTKDSSFKITLTAEQGSTPSCYATGNVRCN